MIKFDFQDKFIPEQELRKTIKDSQNVWEFTKYAEWITKEFDQTKPFHYMEIGSYAGESLYYMSQILPPKSFITLVDLPLNKGAREVLTQRTAPWCAKTYGHTINLVSGDTTNPEVAEKTKAFAPHGRYDLCFIDANHEFAFALNDFLKFRDKANWISFHDISKWNTWKTKAKFGTIQANANHLWEAIKVMVPKTELYPAPNHHHNTPEDTEIVTNWLEFIEYDNKPEPTEEWNEKPRGIAVLRSQW